MKLKVCGMRNSQNIKELLMLRPDYMGFIFYDKSKRNAVNLDAELLKSFPSKTQKVGVFVNAALDEVKSKVDEFQLDFVQLHGDESVEYVGELFAVGIRVIKVFAVGQSFDFNVLKPYKGLVEYFLFDTKGKERGGNGVVFDWGILKDYDQSVPFFLSGGIDNENVIGLAQLGEMNIHAIDVNSKYEMEPGWKDIERINELIKKLSHHER
jgi:phosphoribosylanthranilate isomerase